MRSPLNRRTLLSVAGKILGSALAVALITTTTGPAAATGAWFATSTTLTGNTAKTGVLSAPGTLRNSWSSSTGNTLSWDSATTQPWAASKNITSGITYRLTRHVGTYPPLDIYNGANTSFTDPNQVGRSLRWTQVATGMRHTLAIDENGYLWAWGENSSGQLGNNTTTSSTSPTQVILPSGRTAKQIAAGSFFSAALLDDGTLWMWGENGIGQLGIGNKTQQNLPQRVIFPAGVQVKSLAKLSGASGSMYIIDQNGAIWDWGDNTMYQLGDGTAISTTTPHVLPDLRVSSLSTNQAHVIALGLDGSVWSWGYDSVGQVGDDRDNTYRMTPFRVDFPNAVTPIVQVSSGGRYSVALEANGAIWTWGERTVNGRTYPRVPYVIPTPALPTGVKPIQIDAANGLYAPLSNGAMLQYQTAGGGQMYYNLILDGHFIRSLSNGGSFYALTADSSGSGAWSWSRSNNQTETDTGPFQVASPLVCPYMTKVSGSSCVWDGLLSYSVDYSYGPWRSDFSGLKL